MLKSEKNFYRFLKFFICIFILSYIYNNEKCDNLMKGVIFLFTGIYFIVVFTRMTISQIRNDDYDYQIEQEHERIIVVKNQE